MLETRTSSDEKSQGFIHKEAFERYLSLTFRKLSGNVQEEERRKLLSCHFQTEDRD